MTENEKIALIKATSDLTDDFVISAFLQKAKGAILNRLYSVWHQWPENADVPPRYHLAQCELAIRLANRQGGEGEVIHNENGINRTWDSPDDADILLSITPMVEVPQ